MKRTEAVLVSMIALSIAMAALAYPYMPERMASHWNAAGEADGYMDSVYSLAMLPALLIMFLLMYVFIPRIDPLKHNIKEFRGYFDMFIILISAFFIYVYSLVIASNLGFVFSMTQMMVPALGGLFYYIGILTENAKRNWFIGIRTPWTLSSDRVWNRTHKLGGRLFKMAGVIAVLGILFPDYSILFVLIPVLAVSAYTIVFSYVEYQKRG